MGSLGAASLRVPEIAFVLSFGLLLPFLECLVWLH